MSADAVRPPAPPLEFTAPSCPLCGDPVSLDPDGFVCENCGAWWLRDGSFVDRVMTAETPVEPMTDERLDEIQERADAATPGPWRMSEYDPAEVWADRDPAGWDAFFIATTDRNMGDPNIADAEFIAHSREDVGELLAEVRRLRAELAARPEPIGYVAARPSECGWLSTTDSFATSAEAAEYAEGRPGAWQVCALIPVPEGAQR